MNPCTPIEKKRGRQKIEIKKIEKKSNRLVTFSKRRVGLFKKASELSILCDAKIAILVQSPANKIYTFGSPSFESVLHHCYGYGFTPTVDDEVRKSIWQSRTEYLDAERRLEKEKIMLIKELQELGGKSNEFWWERADFESSMKQSEVEEYLDALERFRKRVMERVDEIKSKSEFSMCLTDIKVDEFGFDDFTYPTDGLQEDAFVNFTDAASSSYSNMITDAETCGVVSETRDEKLNLDALEIPDFSSSNMITVGKTCGVVSENREDELNLDALEIPDFITGFEGDFGCDFDDLGDIFEGGVDKDFGASALGSCSSLRNPVDVKAI